MNTTTTPTAEQITLKAAQILKNLQDAELDGYHGTLTAKQQKQLFGMVLYHNRKVSIHLNPMLPNSRPTICCAMGHTSQKHIEGLNLVAQRVLMNRPAYQG